MMLKEAKYKWFSKLGKRLSQKLNNIKNGLQRIMQFAKDYVDCEEKEYFRIMDEFDGLRS
mgnify:CR=1 FL=1